MSSFSKIRFGLFGFLALVTVAFAGSNCSFDDVKVANKFLEATIKRAHNRPTSQTGLDTWEAKNKATEIQFCAGVIDSETFCLLIRSSLSSYQKEMLPAYEELGITATSMLRYLDTLEMYRTRCK